MTQDDLTPEQLEELNGAIWYDVSPLECDLQWHRGRTAVTADESLTIDFDAFMAKHNAGHRTYDTEQIMDLHVRGLYYGENDEEVRITDRRRLEQQILSYGQDI